MSINEMRSFYNLFITINISSFVKYFQVKCKQKYVKMLEQVFIGFQSKWVIPATVQYS